MKLVRWLCSLPELDWTIFKSNKAPREIPAQGKARQNKSKNLSSQFPGDISFKLVGLVSCALVLFVSGSDANDHLAV